MNKFFVSEEILPQTLSVLQTRSTPLNIELVVGNHETFDFSTEFLVQFYNIQENTVKFMTMLDLLPKLQKTKSKLLLLLIFYR